MSLDDTAGQIVTIFFLIFGVLAFSFIAIFCLALCLRCCGGKPQEPEYINLPEV